MAVGTTTVVGTNTVLFGGQFMPLSAGGEVEGSDIPPLSPVGVAVLSDPESDVVWQSGTCGHVTMVSRFSQEQLFSRRLKSLLQPSPVQSV